MGSMLMDKSQKRNQYTNCPENVNKQQKLAVKMFVDH